MREILFKAKRKDNGEWVEGCLITDELSNAAFIGYVFGTDNGITHDTDLVEVDPETICQYTGLTDKNGKKIFEGDRLSDKYGDTGEVKFGWNYGTCGFYLDGTVDDITEKDLIIIGSIHDEEGNHG